MPVLPSYVGATLALNGLIPKFLKRVPPILQTILDTSDFTETFDTSGKNIDKMLLKIMKTFDIFGHVLAKTNQ